MSGKKKMLEISISNSSFPNNILNPLEDSAWNIMLFHIRFIDFRSWHSLRLYLWALIFSIQFQTNISLPDRKILERSKFKAFAYDKINVTKKKKFVSENVTGKGEIAIFQHLFSVMQCFQKASFSRLLKVRIVW